MMFLHSSLHTQKDLQFTVMMLHTQTEMEMMPPCI